MTRFEAKDRTFRTQTNKRFYDISFPGCIALVGACLALAGCGAGVANVDDEEAMVSDLTGYGPVASTADKCLDAQGGARSRGTRIILWACHDANTQKFSNLTVGQAGPLQIATGRCVTVSGNSTADGTPVELQSCNGRASQQWTYTSLGELRGLGGKCLQAVSSSDGVAAQLFSCTGDATQLWNIQRVAPKPTTTTTTTTTPPIGPSGEPMPVGDLPGWKQVFTDDFTQNVSLGSFPQNVSSRWGAYSDGWKDTSKNGTYYPSKVLSVANGKLDMYLHTENGVHMVAAPFPKIPGAVGKSGGLLYGRYAVRFRADAVEGYKTAWLLWPDSEVWPRDGEIDFPEGDLTGTINAFMHRQNGTSGGDQDGFSSTAKYPDWHTAILEWTPSRINFILDGKTIGSSTSRIPNTPMHWVLQTETEVSSTPPSNAAAGHVEVDWVAVWTMQ